MDQRTVRGHEKKRKSYSAFTLKESVTLLRSAASHQEAYNYVHNKDLSIVSKSSYPLTYLHRDAATFGFLRPLIPIQKRGHFLGAIQQIRLIRQDLLDIKQREQNKLICP